MMHRNKTARIAAELRFMKHIGRIEVALYRLRLAHDDHLGVEPALLNWGDVSEAEELANRLEAAAEFIRAPRAEA